MRIFVTISMPNKIQRLRLAVNYNCVLNTIFEQNKKEVKVGWRKMLDRKLHELYHLLDTLVAN